MIISASYRTDIPTFYARWFLNRLRAGYCRVSNPYNQRPIRVSLARQDVDGFVFWTRNIAPFEPALDEVHERGYPFIVQYTITGYGRELDGCVVESRRSVESLRRVAGRFGPRVCVWRYDPIVTTSMMTWAVHLQNFTRLAQSLEGATDEVVVSFAQFYRKTLRNMSSAGRQFGFEWEDPAVERKRAMIAELAAIAQGHGMRLGVCAQRELIVEGVCDARCVDPDRLEAVAGRTMDVGRKGHREACGCAQSRDIGAYDTCPHGCVYCYAVSSHRAAQMRYRRHDPEAEFLFPPGMMKEPHGMNAPADSPH